MINGLNILLYFASLKSILCAETEGLKRLQSTLIGVNPIFQIKEFVFVDGGWEWTGKGDVQMQEMEYSMCDLIYLENLTKVPRTRLDEIECSTLFIYDPTASTLSENVTSVVRRLVCAEDVHGAVCMGRINKERCARRTDWVEPPDVHERKDGEYIWSIGILSSRKTDSLEFFDQLSNPVLSGKNAFKPFYHYVADPFVVLQDGVYFMFFEIWNAISRLGNIGYASSEDGHRWQFQGIALQENFHMSYPFVFQYEGEYYMIPETHAVHQVRLYHSKAFPFAWELERVLLSEDLCDATVLLHAGLWFMFVSPPSNDRVLLYSTESFQDDWKLHPASPILKGKENGRPGGRPFKVREADQTTTGWIVFIQDCSSAYGAGVNGFELLRLTQTEVALKKMNSTFGFYGSGVEGDWKRFGVHHVDIFNTQHSETVAAIDGWRLRNKNFTF